MLANQDHHLAASLFDGPDPLVRIEFRRVKNRRIFAAIAPFDAPERVRAKMDKERPLQPHPFRLIGTRQNLRRFFRNGRTGIVAGNLLQRGILNRTRRGIIGIRQRLSVGQGKNQK